MALSVRSTSSDVWRIVPEWGNLRLTEQLRMPAGIHGEEMRDG